MLYTHLPFKPIQFFFWQESLEISLRIFDTLLQEIINLLIGEFFTKFKLQIFYLYASDSLFPLYNYIMDLFP